MRNFIGKKTRGLILNWVLISSLLVGLIPAGLVSADNNIAAMPAEKGSAATKLMDIHGHWAEKQITEWSNKGLIEGYQNGTFLPDKLITRVEFVALVNRMFAFKAAGNINFSDVAADAWFAAQVQAAHKAGYIQGYADGTFRPEQQLLRVEAAAILSGLVPLITQEGADKLGRFSDQATVPSYGHEMMNAAIESGYLIGFPDQTVRPMQPITRAEAVVILDRILQHSVSGHGNGITLRAKSLELAGTYGPAKDLFHVAGDLTVNVPDITLQNLIIKGNLLISKSVGEGNVYLNNVTVLGKMIVNGGGENSIHINNSQLGAVVIEKVGGQVRVVVGGTTVVQQMEIKSNAKIESNVSAGSAIEGIVISATGDVTLSGKFANVTINSNVNVTVSSGTIDNLLVDKSVTGSTILLDTGVHVASMSLHGASNINGDGIVQNAIIDSAGVVFQTQPANVEVTEKGKAGTPTSTPTSTPTTAPITAPTTPTTPTNSIDTSVRSVVSQTNATGFRITFSTAVSGLSASNLVLKNASNDTIAIRSVITSDGGNSYRIGASLLQSSIYTVTLTKSGYNFGEALTFTVPLAEPVVITIAASVYAISSNGFTVSLNSPVAGLTNSSFILTTANSTAVPEITEVVTGNSGVSYIVKASLVEGESYSLTIAKTGYSFGGAIAVTVPITQPTAITVVASVYAISAAGFKVLLNVAVTELTYSNFTLTTANSTVISEITEVRTGDNGSSYIVKASLVEGESYSLAIAKAGYSFGGAITIAVPAAADILVTPTVSNITTSGLTISLDKTIPDLDAFSFVLKDSENQLVGVDMLNAADSGKNYEIWTLFNKGKTYSLTLDKKGYTFAEPIAFTVRAIEFPTTVGWISHHGFQLNFESEVNELSAADIVLKDANGNPIAVEAVQMSSDRKSAVISANLSVSQTYQYRIETNNNRFAAGVVTVPETINVSRYSTYEVGENNAITGILVHLSMPVPGLTAAEFNLTDVSGNNVIIDSFLSIDNGNSYLIKSTQMAGIELILGIQYSGYNFGIATRLIRATINPWYVSANSTAFMAGLNPYVMNLTKTNFTIVNGSGGAVPVTDVTWDDRQKIYIVTYDAARGQGNMISLSVPGYDFGAPKVINLAAANTIVNPSYTGFTLALNPPVIIDTVNGFILKKSNGSTVAIKSVTTNDGGASYHVAADLVPGSYSLSVNAALEQTSFDVSVPVKATVSVDQVLNNGFRVTLDYAINSLGASQFVLVNTDKNTTVTIDLAATTDQGKTYRLAADLPGGNYNLKLTGHLPVLGVVFQAQDTLNAGASTITNMSNSGFDLKFENKVSNLLPGNIKIKDAQDNPLSGVTLSTTDNGATYHVNVNLESNQDYSMILHKDYVAFDSPRAFHANYFVTGTVANATVDGKFTLKFSSSLPQLVNYTGLSITNEDGNAFYPTAFAMIDGGASYNLGFTGNSALGHGKKYFIKLDLAGYTLNKLELVTPSVISAADPSTTGVTVHFDPPINSLTKKNFVIRNAQGEAFTVSSAVTTDLGASYVLASSMAGGQFYTVQYNSDIAYQLYEPVDFTVSKFVTATIQNISTKGLKLQFSNKIADLKDQQIILHKKNGDLIANNQYTALTKDGGLSYQFSFIFDAGTDYTLNLEREEFKLAAPVLFDIPIMGSVRLVGSTNNKIVVQLDPVLSDLSTANFALYDSKGSSVAITVNLQSSGILYDIGGNFDLFETYHLEVVYPGYDFGPPIIIGLKVSVDAVTTLQTQKGFKLWLFPAIPDLAKSEVNIKDNNGNSIEVQSIETADFGSTYNVLVPLSGGKTYTITIAKINYEIGSPEPFSLNVKKAAVDQLSINGFSLNLNTPVVLTLSDVSLLDKQGEKVNIRTFVSSDSGLTYQIGAALTPGPGVNYTLKINKMGYDFGADLPISIQPVGVTFDGMESGNNNAFHLVFDTAVPNLRASDFQIRRHDGWVMPVLTAETADGGLNYKLESSFWGAEQYNVLPVKDGYDFGTPVVINVPVIVSSAVLDAGATYLDIGLNPAVPGLDASHFVLIDNSNQTLAASSAVTGNGGTTYRVQASFTGGQTYTIKLQKDGYGFGADLSVDLPRQITSRISKATETGLTVTFSPAISGLSESNFILKNSAGDRVDIAALSSANGGSSYTLTSSLSGGVTYTLSFLASGYSFGSDLTTLIPIAVGKTYSNFNSSGFTIKLDYAVPNLVGSNLSLLNDRGEAVAVSSLTTTDQGLTYTVGAALETGKSYSLSLTKSGYDFGIGLPFLVPFQVTNTVNLLSNKGFTLKLNTAIANLTAGDLTLLSADGKAIAIKALSTSDNGLTYVGAADLTDHQAYTLSIVKYAYDFGTPLQLEVKPLLVLSASNVSASLFYLNLSDAIPALDRNSVHIHDQDGVAIQLTSSNFYDLNWNNANAGRSYVVQIPLNVGKVYTVEVLDQSHPVDAPIEVILPLNISAQVSAAAKDGLMVSFSQAVSDLQTKDIEVLANDGLKVAVSGIVSQETSGKYTIKAALAEGSTYELILHKKGYDFGFGAVTSVYVPISVTASVLNVYEKGFTVSLTAPVPDLNIALLYSGSSVALTSIATPDHGQTYFVGTDLAYNKAFTLRLSKAGYDLGADQTVNNISTPPELIAADSSESGMQVILTFNKPLLSVPSNSLFAVKINSQWQNAVTATLDTDHTKILLSWNTAAGLIIQSSATAVVAYSGTNKVKAANQTYLAVFGETPVANVSTLLGFVKSYSSRYDAAYPAQVLHRQDNKTALETANLLREGEFSVANYARAIYDEYQLDMHGLIQLFYNMNADALTAFQAIDAIGYGSLYTNLVGDFVSVGYKPDEFTMLLRNRGYQGIEVARSLQQSNVSAVDVAGVLHNAFYEASGNTAVLLKSAGYSTADIITAIQSAYALTNADTIQALANGNLSAANAAGAIKTAYGADAIVNAGLLSQAGYAKNAIGAAIAQEYGFTNVMAAVQAFHGAGFSVQDIYVIVCGFYSQKETAIAMLDENLSYNDVAGAVKASGDSYGVVIYAMAQRSYAAKDIALAVNLHWGATGLTLGEEMAQYGSNGFDLDTEASLLREVYAADISTAISALYPSVTAAQRETLFQPLMKAGYNPVELTDYFLKHVTGGDRAKVFKQLKRAGLTTAQAISNVHDVILDSGTTFTLNDAIQIIYQSYDSYAASDVMTALRNAFANDSNVVVDASALAATMATVKLWDKYAVGQALINQMGVTVQQWVELEHSNAFAAYGCPCAISAIVKDTQYLFAGATIEDITIAMSLSDLFTMDQIIEGTIYYYPTGGVRVNALPYMMSSLKNAGYPFADVAAAFDSKGWTDWIAAFSKYGIAASDVVAYLKTITSPHTLTMDEVITKLSPYPLKDITLVLRTEYGLSETASALDLVSNHGYDQEDVARAIAFTYGGNPIALWIMTLRTQGATAVSVINTLAARYPSYGDSEKVGPALIKGGFSKDEVMKGLLIHSTRRSNLKATIGLLQQLYTQEQVNIGQLLTASSSTTSESGMVFLREGGYTLYDIALSLRDYYGMTSGAAASLLSKYYPNDLNSILAGLSSVYGQTLQATASQALETKGLTTIEESIPFLINAGFGLADIAGMAKNQFGKTIGQTAHLLSTLNMADNYVLITTVASVYGQPIELAISEMFKDEGVTSFANTISFVFQSQLGLATSVKVAKDGFRVSAGAALLSLENSNLYSISDIVSNVSNIYGTSQSASIEDLLTAGNVTSLADAIPILRKLSYSLGSIVDVAKEHYHLTSGQTTTILKATGLYTDSKIDTEVAYIYNQTLEQVLLNTLGQLGKTTLESVVPDLRSRDYVLNDLVQVAKLYYNLSAGEATYTLTQLNLYPFADIIASVSKYYRQPIKESLDDMLKSSGIATLDQAAPFLRQMGYSLKDVVLEAKVYYNKTASETTANLIALNLDSVNTIQWTVTSVYSQQTDSTVAEKLEAAGITDAAQAVTYLSNASAPLIDITRTMKEYYSKSAGETTAILADTHLFSFDILLYAINTIYGQTLDTTVLDALKARGLATAEAAADDLRLAGYRMADITRALKNYYNKTLIETTTILTNFHIYQTSAIESIVLSVYGESVTPGQFLQYLLKMKGITTAEGAATYLRKTQTPVRDIVQQLKDTYNYTAAEAVALLTAHYDSAELNRGIASVYYSGQNLGVLIDMMPANYPLTPTGVVNYMGGKSRLTDVVLAMKVLFNLDAIGATDAIPGWVGTAENVRQAIIEVYGKDPLFAFLARMKAQGANANNIASELDRRNLLVDGASGFLVDTLAKLGYDNESILRMRYNYYNETRANEGSAAEQGALLARFGVNTAAAMISYLKSHGNASEYKVISIVRAGLPNASMGDVALAMKAQGHPVQNIMGALDVLNANDDSVAAVLKQLGLSGVDAVLFLKNKSLAVKLNLLIQNGYQPVDYLKYTLSSESDIIPLMKQAGMSASDIAIGIYKSATELNYYTIGKYLFDGGFKDLKDIVGAILAAGCRPVWVPQYIYEINSGAGWTLTDIAKAMLDTKTVSLVELATAIDLVNSDNKSQTYLIIKEVSTEAKQAFYDSLEFPERKVLNNNEIAVIVTLATLRSEGISIKDAGLLLRDTEKMFSYEKAAVMLILSGYNLYDALGAVWDVYRNEIGIDILKKMIGKTIDTNLAKFKDYYKLGKIIYRLVRKDVRG